MYPRQRTHYPEQKGDILRRMAAKSTLKPRATYKDDDGAAPFLKRTELPGVYLNRDGAQVNEFGVLLSLRSVKETEARRDEEILGEPVTSPAMLMKRIALDVSLPLQLRLSAAVSAAPYFDRKMPTAIEGGDADKPIRVETTSKLLQNLDALPPDERKAALAMLERIGALGGEDPA
jgi:hypothetical protein